MYLIARDIYKKYLPKYSKSKSIMKSFKQFNEDLANLQKNLNTLQKNSAPKERLEQRKSIELEKSKLVGHNFNVKSADEVQANKNRMP